MQELVTVITPVFNGEKYLAAALDSLFAQDYRPIEAIVIDDGSQDRSADIVRRYPETRIVVQENRGLANARNLGLRLASGNLIAYLDYDDIWAPNKLSVQVDYLTSRREVMYTITLAKFFLEHDHSLRPGFRKESFETGQVGCAPSALLARRAAFQEVGGFNPEFAIGCDVDWFARARDSGIPMGIVPQVLLFKRIHNANLSANVSTNRRELMQVLQHSIERKRRRAVQVQTNG